MNLKYTEQDIIESARNHKTIADWRKADPRKYGQAIRRGLMPQIREFLVPGIGGTEAAYTEEELAEDAKNYATRAEWEADGAVEMEAGNVSPYHCALRYGPEFFKRHCQHMEQRHRWTDQEVVEAARKYQHRGDWKRSKDPADNAAYQVALTRPSVFEEATAHMTPKAHPYSGDYIVYVYEFADKKAYVGLTFLPEKRRTQHKVRGPVFEHSKVCPEVSYKILEQAIGDPATVGAVERKWIDTYRQAGWTLLNENHGGGLGTVQVTKWTREAVLEEAKKYATKQAWIDASQVSYRIAKREGWFEEAVAHMPKRKLGVGAGRVVSEETREKMRQAKVGKNLSAAHKARISASIHKHWNFRAPASTPEEIAQLSAKLNL